MNIKEFIEKTQVVIGEVESIFETVKHLDLEGAYLKLNECAYEEIKEGTKPMNLNACWHEDMIEFETKSGGTARIGEVEKQLFLSDQIFIELYDEQKSYASISVKKHKEAFLEALKDIADMEG